MAPSGPMFTRACELLADGEWHNMEEVAREVAKVIPPGRAWREAERRRVTQRATGSVPAVRTQQHSDEELIRMGARSLVVGMFAGYASFELRPPGRHVPGTPPKQVRLVRPHPKES